MAGIFGRLGRAREQTGAQSIPHEAPGLVARRELSEILRRVGQGEHGAVEAFRAFEADHRWAEPLQKGSYTVEICEKLLEAAPDSPKAHALYADALTKVGRDADAHAAHIKAVRLLRLRPDPLGPADEAAFIDACQGAMRYHSCDLGEAWVDGQVGADKHSRKLLTMRMPDLTGKSVLDVGAWGGFYSFEAERRGATSVVALDYWSWATSTENRQALENDWGLHDIVDDERLPRKRPFDVARRLLNSKVEAYVTPFEHAVENGLQQFDVVFFMGVLYHSKDPYRLMEALAKVVREYAIIDTVGTYVEGHEDQPLLNFTPTTHGHTEANTWFLVNKLGFERMAEVAGFRKVNVFKTYDKPHSPVGEPARFRLWAECWK